MRIIKSLYPAVSDSAPTNIFDVCFNREEALAYEDYTMFINGHTGHRTSYYEVKDMIFSLASTLGASPTEGGLGLSREKGHMVGILGRNSLEYVTLLQALFSLAVPAAPLSSFATVHELVQLLRTGRVSHLFVDPELFKLALKASHEVGLSEDCIYALSGSIPGCQSLADLVSFAKHRQFARLPTRSVQRDTLAYLLFSSGTTGPPKAVMLSHGNICHNIAQSDVISTWGYLSANVTKQADTVTPSGIPVCIQFLPMHHTYGLSMIALRSTLEQITVILLSRWDARETLNLIPRYGVSEISLVPSVVQSLLKEQEMSPVDLSSLTSIGSGAAYLSQEHAGQLLLAARNASIGNGYGMTEATLGITTSSRPDQADVTGDSVGVLYPGMEARILRSNGSDANTNEPGELFVRGSNIALGYFGNPEASKSTFLPEGWLRTGDVFRVDERGNFFFVDRIKDTLKVSGMQVSPTELESVLLDHPDRLINDVCVAGVQVPRDTPERLPRAWIVLSSAGQKRGAKLVLDDLQRWMSERLSRYKQLRGGIEIISTLPKSPTGKVLRRVLVDQYEMQKAKL